MRQRTLLVSLGSLAVALFLWSAAAPPVEAAPGVVPGAKLYWMQFSNPQSFPALGPTTPVEVRDVRGTWALVESNGIPFEPVWVNFQEVIHYKTEL